MTKDSKSLNNISSFVFHISTPNNEDVEPAVYRNWLAVADGMGGSGCMEHTVDEKFRKSLSKVLSYVLPECTAQLFENQRYRQLKHLISAGDPKKKSYFERIFEPCINDECNTSARWASRIAMVRFLFYVTCSDNNVIDRTYCDNLAKFITKGLVGTQKHLGLTVSNSAMSMLPTTFVAAHYKNIQDSSDCIVNAVWAGDSRLYLLDKNGLRKLTADDENEVGLLTNNFSAKAEGRLNLRTYSLRKPFVLLCASDGFFDAYETTGLAVEQKLLDDINKSKSFKDLRKALIERYNGNLSDDTSVAFAAIGFSDYNQLKNMLSNRYKQINNLFHRYQKYAHIIELIDRPERFVTNMICDRFRSKFGNIISLIIEKYFAGQEDVLLTDWWKNQISECKSECENELSGRKQKEYEKLKKNVTESIKAYPKECLKEEINLNGDIANVLREYRESITSIENLLAKRKELEDGLHAVEEELYEILDNIWEEQERLIDQTIESISLSKEDAVCLNEENKNRRAYTSAAYRLSLMESFALYENFEINEKEKELSYKQFYERICSNHKKRAEQDKEKQSVDKEIFSTERDLNSCFDNIEKNIGQIIEHRREIFTDEFINKSDMNSSADVSINADDVKQFVSSKLVELYGRDEEVIDKTLDELKNHPEEESCVDKIFPQNKLADFRMYYGNIGKADSEEFVKYRDDIAEYMRGIDQLLHNK